MMLLTEILIKVWLPQGTGQPLWFKVHGFGIQMNLLVNFKEKTLQSLPVLKYQLE